MGHDPVSVCPSVRVLTLSNMNISETSGQIAIKFYLKHHWGGGKVALGFGPDRISTLVSIKQIALNTLYLLSPRLCFFIVINHDLFVNGDDSLTS